MGGSKTTNDVPETAATAMALPSLNELRRTGASGSQPTVLDTVLYGQYGDREVPRVRDIRREIVDTSVVVVRNAAIREPRILAGALNPHEEDPAGGDWPQRFDQMLNRVSPSDIDVAVAADVVAQCAHVPVPLAKLVAILSEAVTARLINDGRCRDDLYRKHMSNAARYADIAWCASHGELPGCPSWRNESRDRSEQQVLVELGRHLPAGPVCQDEESAVPPASAQHREEASNRSSSDTADDHWATVVRDDPGSGGDMTVASEAA